MKYQIQKKKKIKTEESEEKRKLKNANFSNICENKEKCDC